MRFVENQAEIARIYHISGFFPTLFFRRNEKRKWLLQQEQDLTWTVQVWHNNRYELVIIDLIFQRNSRWWRDKIIDLMKKNWKYLLKNRNNTLSICYHLNLTHKLISYKEQIYQTVKLLACFKAALQNTWCKGIS